MEKEVAIANIKQISSQRNLFLTLSLALSVTCAGLTFKILNTDQRTILVPGLAQEVWTENSGVSKGYLELTASSYLPYLLNLSKDDVNYNIRQIFTQVSHSDPKYLKKLQEYFTDVKEKYSKFNLMTHFTAKNMEVDSKKLTVTAHGILTCIYGEHGFESIPRSYKLTFERVGGSLRIKEFLRVAEKGSRSGAGGNEKEKDSQAGLTDFVKTVE